MDITRRPSDKWIIDFGWTMSEAEAALYEPVYEYALKHIRDDRVVQQKRGYARNWWRHERSRQDMWKAIGNKNRYIATVRHSKHRIFQFFPSQVVPDSALIVIAREDLATFGIVHSRFNELWSLRLGSSLEDRPRYTPSTTFETFPFPFEISPDCAASRYENNSIVQSIADAVEQLNRLRLNWLNPPDLVLSVPEVVKGYPSRLLPKDDAAEAVLRKRTLTKLYNVRPSWLANAHRELDQAVAAAYGWPEDISDEDALAELFALNQARA